MSLHTKSSPDTKVQAMQRLSITLADKSMLAYEGEYLTGGTPLLDLLLMRLTGVGIVVVVVDSGTL